MGVDSAREHRWIVAVTCYDLAFHLAFAAFVATCAGFNGAAPNWERKPETDGRKGLQDDSQPLGLQ